jgi:hypothetical protein
MEKMCTITKGVDHRKSTDQAGKDEDTATVTTMEEETK